MNTVPLWKSQMVLALGVEHSAQAARAQREVTDMTNELLRKNAERLKMATIETARAVSYTHLLNLAAFRRKNVRNTHFFVKPVINLLCSLYYTIYGKILKKFFLY